MKIDIEKHYKLIFGSIYPLYVAKVERKGKTKEELDVVISWLTGYDQKQFNIGLIIGLVFWNFSASTCYSS